MQTNQPSPRCRWRLPSALFLVGVVTLSAQTTPPSSEDEIVTLSEFTVRTDPADSYSASETITGSRVAEKIKNLPYTVNVLTSEFIDDFGFFDFGDDFAYTSSFGGYDPGGGTANVRGLAVGKSLRNGFLRIGVVDRANIDRIEIIKGPSAAVYGEASRGASVRSFRAAWNSMRTGSSGMDSMCFSAAA